MAFGYYNRPNATTNYFHMRHKRILIRVKQVGEGFITLLIVLNAFVAGLLTDASIKLEYGNNLNAFCDISAFVFIFEMFIRIIRGGKDFWVGKEKRWNIFDLIITGISSISIIYANNSLITFRIFREFRVLRIFSRFKNLRTILDAMINSFSKIAWTGVLFFVFYYVYAIIGVNFFCKEYPDYFGNIKIAIFTLFQIMTLDDWNKITKEVLEIYPLAWMYFISFILIVSYILLNFIVGIIISSLGVMMDPERQDVIVQIEQDIKDVRSRIKKIEVTNCSNHTDIGQANCGEVKTES